MGILDENRVLDMPNDEIVMRYKQAKDKTAQVRILAELNACPVERIIGILTNAGIDHRCFSMIRRKMNQESAAEKIPYKKPEIIPAPPEKKESAAPAEEHTPEVPKAVIAAVEDKITELQYMINQNKDTVKSLLQHNEKFSDRIGILTAWLEEVKK